MSRSKWTIRNYNTALRELKKHGFSHREAQIAYKGMRGRLGRPLFGIDIKKHPRIAAQELKLGRSKRIMEDMDRAAKKLRIEKAAAAEYEVFEEEPSTITDVEYWQDNWDDWNEEYDIEVEEWESTADYEEAA